MGDGTVYCPAAEKRNMQRKKYPYLYPQSKLEHDAFYQK